MEEDMKSKLASIKARAHRDMALYERAIKEDGDKVLAMESNLVDWQKLSKEKDVSELLLLKADVAEKAFELVQEDDTYKKCMGEDIEDYDSKEWKDSQVQDSMKALLAYSKKECQKLEGRLLAFAED